MKKKDLVQNTIVDFNDIVHIYRIGEKELIGVTSLMRKHGLGADYSGISEEVLANAAERGHQIHRMLENYDNNDPVLNDEFQKELKAYAKLGLNVICSEYLVSDNETVASSIDKVIGIPEEEDMVDIADVKTTYKVHTDAVKWQLGIYKYLFELQNPGKKVRRTFVIHVRDGKAVEKDVTPVSREKVEELIRCEREGMIYLEDFSEEVTVNGFDDTKLLQLVSCMDELAALETSAKIYQETAKQLMDELYSSMLEENIDEIPVPDGRRFVLKRPYKKVALDSKKLKEDNPELFEKYSKESMVKGNVTLK